MVVTEGFVGDGEHAALAERSRAESERKRSKPTRSSESCLSDVTLSGEALTFFDVVPAPGSVNPRNLKQSHAERDALEISRSRPSW